MKLLKLRLTNFKGCRTLELNPNGQPLTIYGDNATGKTTVADALYWLLFGKNAAGTKDFDIKTLGPDGKPIHRLDHEVEATLKIDGMGTRRLRRLYRETWTTQKGRSVAELTGHSTDYFIDDVPHQAKQFEAFVASICPADTFRMLTDPEQFADRTHWSDRRKLLAEIAGGVSDAEVMVSDPDLFELRPYLENPGGEPYSIDGAARLLAAQKKLLDEQRNELPTRISEVSRTAEGDLPALIDPEPIRTQIAELQSQIAQATQQSAIGHIEAEILQARNKVENRHLELRRGEGTAHSDASAEVGRKRNALTLAESSHSSNKRILTELDTEIDTKVAKLAAHKLAHKAAIASAPEFPAVVDTCAACGQSLPEDRVEAARSNATAQANQKRASELEEMTARGKAMSEALDKLRANRDELAERVEGLAKEVETAKADLVTAENILAGLSAPKTEWPDDPVLIQLAAEIERLNEQKLSSAEALGQQIAGLESQVREKNERLLAAMQSQAAHDQAKGAKERLQELEDKLAKTNEQYDHVLRGLDLIEMFNRAKARLFEEHVNRRFDRVRFRLFRDQLNGGLDECCDVTVDGVPFASLNTGMKINAGLEIIDVLAAHYGFAPPIVIDNAESITALRPTLGQQIRLVVSAADKALRIESGAPTEAQPTLALV